MNPKSIFNLFSPKGKAPAVGARQISALAISLAVWSLLVLTACGPVPASVAVIEEAAPAVAPAAVTEKEAASDSAFLAANPELLVAHPPAEAQEMTESEFLAANPELKIVRRYTGAIENEGSQPATYDIEVVRHKNFTDFQTLKANLAGEENIADHAGADNVAALRYKFRHGLGIEANIENEGSRPDTYDIEVIRTQNYAAFLEKNSLDAFVEANPELRFARRRLATAIEETANPELSEKLARRWMMTQVDSTFLAANPELMVARRSAITLKDEVSQPETYDIEMLRIQRYAEAAEKRAEAAFLAANPELMVARRYEAMGASRGEGD